MRRTSTAVGRRSVTHVLGTDLMTAASGKPFGTGLLETVHGGARAVSMMLMLMYWVQEDLRPMK